MEGREREGGALVPLPNGNQSPKKHSLVFSSRRPQKYMRRRGVCVCRGWGAEGRLLHPRRIPKRMRRGWGGNAFISSVCVSSPWWWCGEFEIRKKKNGLKFSHQHEKLELAVNYRARVHESASIRLRVFISLVFCDEIRNNMIRSLSLFFFFCP